MSEKCYFIKEGQTRNDIARYLGNDVIAELNAINGFFKEHAVAFVGKYTLKDKNVVYSCPKYVPDKDIHAIQKSADAKNITVNNNTNTAILKEHITTILNVLKKLKKEDPQLDEDAVFAPNERQKESKFIDRISLAEYILNDYMNHGLYYDDYKMIGRQGKGKISWNQTIKKTAPFFDDDEVIYMNLIKKYNFKDYYNLMTRIHASVIRYAYDFTSHFGDSGNMILPDVEPLSREDLEKKEIVNYIRDRMRKVFSNREIYLFRALYAWCTESQYYTRFIFGSTAFHVIWEMVNDKVWGDGHNEKSSKEPIYNFFTSNDGLKSFEGKGISKIDTLRIVEPLGSNTKYAAVFDSKYYVIRDILPGTGEDADGEIDGYPSNSDISKQVGYLNLIKGKYKQEQGDPNEVIYSNAFLLPKINLEKQDKIREAMQKTANETEQLPLSLTDVGCSDGMYNISGYATRGTYSREADPNPVLLIHCDPDKLYEYYLQGKKMEDCEIVKIAKRYNEL